MKKLLLAILLLCGVGKCYAFGPEKSEQQDSVSILKEIPKRNFVWLNVGQLGFKEIQLGFEKQTNANVSVEGTLGFKYPVRLNQPYGISIRSIGPGYHYDYIAWVPFSTGILANLAVKKYLNFESLPGWYISGGFFYRHWFFNHQHVSSGEMDSQSSNNFTSKQSLRMHVSGFKLLMGHTITCWEFPDNKALMLDLYYGIGYRKKLVNTHYDSFYDDRYQGPYTQTSRAPFSDTDRSVAVSIQLGLKLGLQF